MNKKLKEELKMFWIFPLMGVIFGTLMATIGRAILLMLFGNNNQAIITLSVFEVWITCFLSIIFMGLILYLSIIPAQWLRGDYKTSKPNSEPKGSTHNYG